MKIEINGAFVEALSIANEDHEEPGIWIPCSVEIQEQLDGETCNVQIEVQENENGNK